MLTRVLGAALPQVLRSVAWLLLPTSFIALLLLGFYFPLHLSHFWLGLPQVVQQATQGIHLELRYGFGLVHTQFLLIYHSLHQD